MSIMKKKKKKKRRRRKKRRGRRRRREFADCILFHCTQWFWERLRKKCRPWPDLQLAHQLGWHLCASCPKLSKTYKTVSFLGSHHVTHICEQVTSTISFHCLTSEVWSAPMQLLLTKYWVMTSLQRTKELTLATVPYCTEASVVGCLEKIVHPKAWRKFIPPQVR